MARIPKNHDWIKLYHKEWLTKLSIRSCDAATRGIYSDLKALSALSEEEGVIFASDKEICRQLAIKPSQYNRAVSKLIEVKLCVRGKNNELILTEMASVEYQLSAEKVPMSAQSELNESQLEPIERPTSKENGSLPLKIDAPIIDKKRKEENKSNIPPKSPQFEIMTMDDNSQSGLFNESLILLSQTTGLEEEKCRPVIGRWLKQLDGNAQMLASMIDKGLLANAPIPYITKMVANAVKARHGSNVTYFQPRKTNKQQMTEAWGLSESVVNFQEKYGDEEPTLEQLQSHNPRKAWGI